jgi:hypothetical protein
LTIGLVGPGGLDWLEKDVIGEERCDGCKMNEVDRCKLTGNEKIGEGRKEEGKMKCMAP